MTTTTIYMMNLTYDILMRLARVSIYSTNLLHMGNGHWNHFDIVFTTQYSIHVSPLSNMLFALLSAAQWHQSIPMPMKKAAPRTGSRYAALTGQGLDIKSIFPSTESGPILFASSPLESKLESEELWEKTHWHRAALCSESLVVRGLVFLEGSLMWFTLLLVGTFAWRQSDQEVMCWKWEWKWYGEHVMAVVTKPCWSDDTTCRWQTNK